MKINIFTNDYFTKYNSPQTITTSLDPTIIEKIPSEHFLILRGEPTLHSEFYDILSIMRNRKYLLTLEGKNIGNLLIYKKAPPYLSFYYDGFLNDALRSDGELTSNVIKTLNFYKGKETVIRLAYTISPFNRMWFDADIAILKNFVSLYPQMKLPYFLIYQQGVLYKQEDFKWTAIDKNMIDNANRAGILTQNNLNFLISYYTKKTYSCVAPQNELVIFPDKSLRMCMSHRISEVIGDLKSQTIEESIRDSEEKRREALNCPFRQSCWLAYHYKENIGGHISK